MNRREFLQNSSIFVGATILSPLLSACGGGTSVVVQRVVKHVGIWFAEYLLEIAADKAFASIAEFSNNQSSSEARRIEEVNDMMRENGFTKFDGHAVHKRNGIYTYDVGHRDGFNGCAAFFDGRKYNTALIEGPTVVGLAMAANEYRSAKGISATAQAFIPTGEYQRPRENAFGKNYDKEYVAYTDFGALIVDYRTTSSNSGEVTVTLADQNAQKRFEGIYNLNFS